MPAIAWFLISGLYFWSAYDGQRVRELEKKVETLTQLAHGQALTQQARDSRMAGWGMYR